MINNFDGSAHAEIEWASCNLLIVSKHYMNTVYLEGIK